MITFWISAIGLAIGAGMGVGGLVNPRWAASLVRLRDNPETPGGFAEFRGTYGGLFLGAHAVALVLVHTRPGSFGMGAIAVCAAMWIGTAIGRTLSMVADRSATKFNLASVAFEMALGLAIASPWFEVLAAGAADL